MNTIKVSALKYHRNGVGGIGFAAVRFSFQEGREQQQAIATVFSTDSEDETKFTGYCAVLLLDEQGRPRLDRPMRGDHFEDGLRRFIASDAGQAMMFPHLAAEAV